MIYPFVVAGWPGGTATITQITNTGVSTSATVPYTEVDGDTFRGSATLADGFSGFLRVESSSSPDSPAVFTVSPSDTSTSGGDNMQEKSSSTTVDVANTAWTTVVDFNPNKIFDAASIIVNSVASSGVGKILLRLRAYSSTLDPEGVIIVESDMMEQFLRFGKYPIPATTVASFQIPVDNKVIYDSLKLEATSNTAVAGASFQLSV